MNTYIQTTLNNWKQIFDLDKYFLSPFVFRGQKDNSWDLKTSIERIKKDFSKFKYANNYDTEEKWMLHEFIRKSHLYSNITISSDDKFEWLAIMQHHGAPTRLLDFTESIFIATYFAIIENTTDSSIWAINRFKLRNNLFEKYKLPYKKGNALKDEINLCHINFANQFIAKRYSIGQINPTIIVPLEPKLFSERLARQQGLFLMPTNSKLSFMKNLESSFNRDNSEFTDYSFEDLIDISNDEKYKSGIEVLKINLPKSLFKEIADNLKEMNITAEIMFPGLDGLAKSLVHTQIIV